MLSVGVMRSHMLSVGVMRCSGRRQSCAAGTALGTPFGRCEGGGGMGARCSINVRIMHVCIAVEGCCACKQCKHIVCGRKKM